MQLVALETERDKRIKAEAAAVQLFYRLYYRCTHFNVVEKRSKSEIQAGAGSPKDTGKYGGRMYLLAISGLHTLCKQALRA